MMSVSRNTTWTAEQQAYDQALSEGPTAALDRFRTLIGHRASASVMSEKDELFLLSEVLVERFGMLEKDMELWRASLDTEFIIFLTNVIAAPDFLDHHPVSKLFRMLGTHLCLLRVLSFLSSLRLRTLPSTFVVCSWPF